MKISAIAEIVLALALPMIANAESECVPGKPQPVFSVPQGSETDSVAVAPNGDVFTVEVYTGTVYRIDRDGNAKVIATLFPAGK